MNRQEFLWLGIVFSGIYIWWLIRSQKKNNPGPDPLVFKPSSLRLRDMSESTAHERSLTTIFQYNGHSWDAFEVLGLPAGSSDQKAEEAFQKSIKTAHSQSREFFEAAINAIRNKDKN